jgi:hypothetical protein
LTALQVQQQRSIGRATPEGEVVHTEHFDLSWRRQHSPADGAEQRVTAARELPAPQMMQEPTAGASTEQKADQFDQLTQSQRAPGVGHDNPRESFGEDGARTVWLVTKEAAHLELEAHRDLEPR